MDNPNRFKRLVHLLWLYTKQAEQGSEGLNVTCAAHFKDTPMKWKHHGLLKLKCNSGILPAPNATISNTPRF